VPLTAIAIGVEDGATMSKSHTLGD